MANKEGVFVVIDQTRAHSAIRQHIGIPAFALGLAGFAYFLLSLVLFFAGRFRFLPRVMAWNLFLAMLPLAFSVLARGYAQNAKTVPYVLTGVFWLLFFPNAPYMITDLIHLHLFDYYADGLFLRDIVAWAWLLYMTVGVLLGLTAGMLSLEMMRKEVIRRKSRDTANLMVAAVALISGYAIYIGRFLRFNSWDVLRPWSLTRRLIQDFGGFTLVFSCLAAVFVLLVYGLFHMLYATRYRNDSL